MGKTRFIFLLTEFEFEFIFMSMKIKILRNVLVEVQKPRLQETWDKQLKKWEEVRVESINYAPGKKAANIVTYEGDTIISIPADAFELLS